jgi:NtrC-family two-component system sensor histidine kinase KinB
MQFRSLRTRFLVAGCVLVAATVGCGAWSAWTFLHLSSVVGETLKDSEETVDLSVALSDAIEREDDALLLFLAGKEDAAMAALDTQRRRFDAAYVQIMPLMHDDAEKQAAADLRRHVDAYRKLGDDLRQTVGSAEARYDAYHQHVNPALRQAVADCAQIRALNFGEMKQAGVQARTEARRSTMIVALVSLAALALSAAVTVRLAQAVLVPIRELARSVEAIRRDDLQYRVPVRSEDELGQLAEGFNRMVETLQEYRNSSLGELLLAKATLEATLAALPDAVVVVNPDGQIASKNPLADDLLHALGGGSAKDIRELPVRPAVVATVEAVLRGEEITAAHADLSQTLAVSLKGRNLKMLLTVAPIRDFLPRRQGAALVLADVTDFARLDELRTELVAVASHELKTPLTSLGMNLLLLRERADNLNPRQHELLGAALDGVEELGSTIDELLDLTRIEAGQLRLQHDRVDLLALARQLTQTLRPRFDDAEVRLRLVNDGPSAVVRGDAARLKIVFANLLVNALKYTPRGGEVLVRLWRQETGEPGAPQTLHLTVTDTGPGIAPGFRERVFEKFFRVEHQRESGQEGVRGAGIGLYLCRQIVEAHGGSIRCEGGDDDRGTRIHLQLADSPVAGGDV